MNEELVEKYKIKKFYKYVERRIGNQVEFGWAKASADEVELPIVISYDSKSKSVAPEMAAWSQAEGINATSLKDYIAYFTALVGQSPVDFLLKWKDRLEEFPSYWGQQHEKYNEEHGKLIVALAKFLTDEKKFSLHGRTYKVIR